MPRRYMEIMTDTASKDMRWVSERDARLMLEVPSIAEWISAAYGQQLDRAQEEQALSLLNRHACKGRKIDNAQDAITEFSDK